MAERKECLLYWDGNVAYFSTNPETSIRMVEVGDDERVLTAEEWRVVARLLVASHTLNNINCTSDPDWHDADCAFDNAESAIPASLLAAAKETR